MPFDGQDMQISAPPREPGCVRAVIFYNPLDADDRGVADIEWRQDKTVAEYLDGLPEGVTWTVAAAGRVLERDEWESVTLTEDDFIVLAATPEKGGQGLMIVAAIVLAVVSAGVGAAIAGGALAGTAFASATGLALTAGSISATVVAGIAGAAISIGGSMLLNAVFPPAVAKANKNGVSSNEDNSPSYSISGPISTSRENSPVPIVYGEYEVGGNRINAYTENTADGKTQYLYLQYAVCDGEVDSISNLKINGQPLSNFQDVVWDWRPGTLGQTQLGWFINTPVTYNDGRTLSTTPVVYTTTEPVDRVQADIVFPNGLYSLNQTNGNREQASVAVVGTATNISTGITYPFSGSNWIPAGLAGALVSERGTAIRVTMRVNGASGANPSTPYTAGCLIQTSADGITYGNFSNETRSGRVANNYVSDGNWAAGQELVVFEVPVNSGLPGGDYFAVYPSGGTIISIEVLKQAETVITRSERGSFTLSIDTGPLPRGRYDIRVSRANAQSTSDYLSDQVVLGAVKEIQADPVRYSRTAYYALRIRLSGQLNNVPNTTVRVRGRKVNIYDANGNVLTRAWSNNPADIALDLLLSPNSQRPLSPSRIDFPWFSRWRGYCASNSLFFNGVIDYITNTWDALVQVMRVGRASPVMQGLRWSGVMEAPTTPTMMFGDHNIIKGSFQNTWLSRQGRANSVEGQYYDKNDGFKQRSVFAIDFDSIARGEALVETTINLVGVTDAAQAQKEVDLQLRLNQYIVQGCSFRANLDALNVAIGDVVYVQHSMPKWGWGDRVRSVAGSTVQIYNPMLGSGTGQGPLPVQDVSGNWYVPPTSEADLRIATEDYGAPNMTTEAGDGILVEEGGAIGEIGFLPAGDWRILVLKPAIQRDTATVSVVSGNQITVNKAISGSVRITRVKIAGKDYAVYDRVNFASTTVFVLDRPASGSLGLTAELWETEVMAEGTIERPSENAVNLTVTSWTHSFPIEPGDQVLIGRVGKFKKAFRIIKFGHESNMQRSVECLEYNEAIYNPTGIVPDTNYSELNAFPIHVGNLQARQITENVQGGGYRYIARADWVSPLNDQRGHGGVYVYVSVNFADFTFYENVPAGRDFSLYEAQVDQVIRFKVVAYDKNGVFAPGATSPIAAITIGRRTRAPLAPTAFAASGGIRLISLSWARPADEDIKSYQVYENTTNNFGTAYVIAETQATGFTRHGLNPNETRYYWVRSVSYGGEYSLPVGPASAMTSMLIASDIQDGILNTAKFAQTIRPVGVPATVGELIDFKVTDQVIFPQVALTDPVTAQALSAQRLYRWSGTEWVPVVNATDMAGQIVSTQISDNAITTDKLAANSIVAGKIAAGAISASEIAAGAITASKLASETLITESAQIGNLVVDTLQIKNNAVTDVFLGTWSGSYAPNTGEAALTSVFPTNVGTQLFIINAAIDSYFADLGTGGGSFVVVKVYLNGGLIMQGSTGYNTTLIKTIYIGGGTHTLTLSVTGQNVIVSNATLLATRVKK